MASPLRYVLVSDRSTDHALLPIIDWLLLSIPELGERGIESQWADLRGKDKAPGLAGKIQAALRNYPCDILFVHRDAEASIVLVSDALLVTRNTKDYEGIAGLRVENWAD